MFERKQTLREMQAELKSTQNIASKASTVISLQTNTKLGGKLFRFSIGVASTRSSGSKWIGQVAISSFAIVRMLLLQTFNLKEHIKSAMAKDPHRIDCSAKKCGSWRCFRQAKRKARCDAALYENSLKIKCYRASSCDFFYCSTGFVFFLRNNNATKRSFSIGRAKPASLGGSASNLQSLRRS